jgi:hypothetical protein
LHESRLPLKGGHVMHKCHGFFGVLIL